MVEVSITLVTTISTIIVVTMATIFFCCWRKKGSGDLTEGKFKKQQEAKKEPSPAPATSSKPENGVVSQNPSPSEFVDSNDDLGDFSAVQRETEILRSYRKPPPPKNRARQSRAPRPFKNSTENLDIFTELSEEENKENIVAKDEVDSALLRPKSDKDATTREARSSMLADIEQTLAAMHDQDKQGDNKPSIESEDLKITAESGGEKTSLKEDRREKEDRRKSDLSETAKNTSFGSGDSGTSSPSSALPEIKTTHEKASPKSSPIGKPKRGPKVSPKPSPKLTAKLSGGADKPAASVNLTLPSDNQEAQSPSSEFKSANATTTPELNSSSLLPLSPSKNSNSKVSGVTMKMNKNKNNSAEKPQDQAIVETKVTSPSETNPPNLVNSELKESDASVEATPDKRKSSESATSVPQIDTAAEKENTAEKVSKDNTEALAASEADGSEEDIQAPEPQPDAAAAAISMTAAENHETHEEATSNADAEDISAEECDASSAKTEHTSRSEVKDEGSHDSPEGDAKGHEPKNVSPTRTEGPGKQRRESAEDQSGKGKKSKLPVRAGSKTRSSPPKTDKPASP